MPIDTDIFHEDSHHDETAVPTNDLAPAHLDTSGSIEPNVTPVETVNQISDGLPSSASERVPFKSWKQKATTANGIMAIIGGLFVAAIIMFFLTTGSKKPTLAVANSKQSPSPTAVAVPAPAHNTPTNDVAAAPTTASTQLTPNEILGTKTGTSMAGKSAGSAGSSDSHTIQVGDHSLSDPSYGGNSSALSNVASFSGVNRHYQVPPPDSGTSSPGYMSTGSGVITKPSLVFTRKGTELDKVNSATNFPVLHSSNFGLPVGFKVAVRLESVATTAIKSPVIAVVEYNVEKDGQVIIPAGAKFIGTISEADRNGAIGFQFTRLLEHDGTGLSIAAIAVDKNLGALKGDVTGKNTGKKIIVGIAQGLGSAGSVVIGGTSNISQPYSESDAIRQQVAQNAGTTGNNAIQSMSQSEHIVVTLPAGAEFYAEFVDSFKTPQ